MAFSIREKIPSLTMCVGGRDLPEDIERVNKLVEVHKHPFYLAFLKHPQLRQFVREFMGWKNDVLVKRTMLRHNVPSGLSTGVHYDRLFLRAGEAEFLTAWVPIGDVAATGGGLVYLEHSDDIGREMESEFMKKKHGPSCQRKGLRVQHEHGERRPTHSQHRRLHQRPGDRPIQRSQIPGSGWLEIMKLATSCSTTHTSFMVLQRMKTRQVESDYRQI